MYIVMIVDHAMLDYMCEFLADGQLIMVLCGALYGNGSGYSIFGMESKQRYGNLRVTITSLLTKTL